ncbi:MAG: hypothetical protein HZA00_04865 [Nitrospinae bacterium]|nr:hypothetical protein [Nitrospinota bacterium]
MRLTNRIIYIFLIICIAFGFVTIGCEKTIPDTPPVGSLQEPKQSAKEAATAFKNRYPTAAISWNAKNGYIQQITNFLGPTTLQKEPVAAAKEFIIANASLFGLKPEHDQLTLLLLDEAKSKDGKQIRSRFVRFGQHREKLPVYEGEIVVHLTASNRPYTVNNSLKVIERIEGQMKLNSEEAIVIAKNIVKKKFKLFDEVKAAPIIFPMPEYGIRAWQVDVGQWRVIINALNGDALLVRDMSYSQNARVYQENRVRDGGNTSIVPIGNLNAFATTLTGTRVAINNLAGALTNSASQQFQDTPGDINFDDQMVYTHTDSMFTFYNSLGIALPNNALIANTNANFSCNAFYTRTNDSFSYGVAGSGCGSKECQSAAHFADVIFHETTHRVLNVAAGLTGNSNETGAIHEGTSDYYSSSVTGNSCLAEEFFNGETCLRNIEPNRNYPSDMEGESHNDGLIWASALWDIRSLLGKETADRIIREGMRGLPANATFSDYAGNIITQGTAYYLNLLGDNAWENFFRLLHIAAVIEGSKQTFCNHGIAAPYGSFVERTITTPGSGNTLDVTITVPSGEIIDTGRGCKGGYDITSINGNEWDDLKEFNKRKNELEIYEETLSNNSLRIRMRAPGGCGSVPQATLRYIVYHKRP